jgi:succinate dehydrogenase / fumarate reductase cytochrome b subunit
LSERKSRLVSSSRERRAFIVHRLFSLTGVVPVGAFFVVHLWTYASALGGREAFDEAALDSHQAVYLLFVEALFIWLPIVFHALYGLKLTLSGRPNVGRYPNFANWMYVLQRATGILVLFFIGYHFWHLRLPLLVGTLDRSDVFGELCASLSSTTKGGIPLVALAYLAGLAASAFHLANGLYGFCFAWGITVSRRATRIASTAFGILGIVLFALGANTVIYFATGSRLTLSLREPHGPATKSCADLADQQSATNRTDTATVAGR